MSKTPIVLIFFNRPDKLAQVWDVVSRQQPEDLILVSDGPAAKADEALVQQCRDLVQPHWDCRLIKVYREHNYGLSRNVINALDQVFSQFDQAIVLEDDCVPHPSFFSFSSRLLNHYASDDRILSITGLNQFSGRFPWTARQNYAFSRYFVAWGWAAWRRTWQLCNWDDRDLSQLIGSASNKTALPDTGIYWRRLLSKLRQGKELSWATRLCLTGLATDKLTIIPQFNAIDNVGMSSGVHFSGRPTAWKLPPLRDIDCVAPPDSVQMQPDDAYDALFERRHFDPNPVRRVLRRMFCQ